MEPSKNNPTTDELIAAAAAAREHAHADYSGFKVGAALLTTDHRVYTGCNIETVCFNSICAERVALFKALSEGLTRFAEVVVVTDTEKLTPPCGVCRQILWEFCGDVPVTMANLNGKTAVHRLGELLPLPFDKHFLKSPDTEQPT